MSMHKSISSKILLLCMVVLPIHFLHAQDGQWQPVTGAETLSNFMSGLSVERELPNGEISRGVYRADGTGTLYSWGAELPRTWEVRGDEQICITERSGTLCYSYEKSTAEPGLYRAREATTGILAEFRVVEQRAVSSVSPEEAGAEGGAAAASADELAAELSNPNTSVASLTFKNQFRWFDGNLHGAADQTGFTMLFQPSLPFMLESGSKILWRPAIPLLIDQPVFDAASGEFEGKSGLGDIAFDLAYAPKTEGGLLLGFGMITSLPTATNGLGSKRWTLGPEMLIGKVTPSNVVGVLPSHQWDVAGSGEADINLTTIQAFYTYLPGGGWSVGSAPIMNYDWNAEQWTVPLQVNTGKTVMIKGRPWKMSAELNYYVEKADTFGPEWMLSFNIAPVVKNGMASWFGL